MPPWDEIARSVSEAIGARFVVERSHSVGGGCINTAYRIEGSGHTFFVKLNEPDRLTMFEAEAAGLDEIARSAAIRVPRPICSGSNAKSSWLALEHIGFRPAGKHGMRELGRGLARLHRVTAPQFGWDRDNTIGATPQVNTPDSDWIAFWRARRLGFQLDLAARNGHTGRLQQRGRLLMDRLPGFFRDHTPAPSLLHGDLWNGNAGFDGNGNPVIYDPAVYYGDREADVAMTGLFGGFSADFYSGYDTEFPLDAGYASRQDLYNLYHVLNHLNLFGGGYGAQAERMIDRLLDRA